MYGRTFSRYAEIACARRLDIADRTAACSVVDTSGESIVGEDMRG